MMHAFASAGATPRGGGPWTHHLGIFQTPAHLPNDGATTFDCHFPSLHVGTSSGGRVLVRVHGESAHTLAGTLALFHGDPAVLTQLSCPLPVELMELCNVFTLSDSPGSAHSTMAAAGWKLQTQSATTVVASRPLGDYGSGTLHLVVCDQVFEKGGALWRDAGEACDANAMDAALYRVLEQEGTMPLPLKLQEGDRVLAVGNGSGALLAAQHLRRLCDRPDCERMCVAFCVHSHVDAAGFDRWLAAGQAHSTVAFVRDSDEIRCQTTPPLATEVRRVHMSVADERLTEACERLVRAQRYMLPPLLYRSHAANALRRIAAFGTVDVSASVLCVSQTIVVLAATILATDASSRQTRYTLGTPLTVRIATEHIHALEWSVQNVANNELLHARFARADAALRFEVFHCRAQAHSPQSALMSVLVRDQYGRLQVVERGQDVETPPAYRRTARCALCAGELTGSDTLVWHRRANGVRCLDFGRNRYVPTAEGTVPIEAQEHAISSIICAALCLLAHEDDAGLLRGQCQLLGFDAPRVVPFGFPSTLRAISIRHTIPSVATAIPVLEYVVCFVGSPGDAPMQADATAAEMSQAVTICAEIAGVADLIHICGWRAACAPAAWAFIDALRGQTGGRGSAWSFSYGDMPPTPVLSRSTSDKVTKTRESRPRIALGTRASARHFLRRFRPLRDRTPHTRRTT